ncbi:MAG: aminotransferase class V-fold PLP-dependent enzyme, partial [Bacteroidetes bacterium]|nr:aminotransferase class V-fold PLP-dependent enzyme [Bacteroidota bacterium]
YADWTASGRMYEPIEKRLLEEIAPYVGNTHTESSMTGAVMTKAYHSALQFIKKQVGADENDVIISSGSGMTGVVNKFQRMLGLRLHEKYIPLISIPENKKPVVFVSHMEHHSNQTSWLETMADVEIIQPTEDGLVDVQHLKELLKRYSGRETKIAAITSCSNVTGIFTPYFEVAEIMHRHGGLCFVDFACSAPYININMHPGNPLQKLDAIYFSPHKFLGGPGTSGILVFDSKLYHNRIPDDPGGGTVDWTNPWGERKYIDDIEMREDGGTPAFIQTIKVALCMKLKEEMGINQMLAREEEMLAKAWDELNGIPNLHILANRHQKRLSIISFYIDGLHYNLAVRILNDRFGIQVRGGCSCAGTYGHYLLNVDREHSKSITEKINIGDLSEKPGWIRFSFHPVMSNDEAGFIVDAIRQLCEHFNEWKKDYVYNQHSNTFSHVQDKPDHRVEEWFEESLI